AGKTTLLKAIAGLIRIESGQIMLGDSQLMSLDAGQRARKVAYLAQERIAHWPLLVERVVALGRFPHLAHWQQPGEQDQRIIDAAMRATDVYDFRQRRISELSGGERMRVLLARALAVQADILLADEPVNALDPAHALAIMQLLRNSCEQGASVIAVMHDLTLAARFCHRLVLMDGGRIIASGSPQEVLTDDHLRQVYHIETYPGNGDEFVVLPWTLCE
ncbi:MAG: ABC transporter ATP-binding protein, partial [Gammaproteobacteria bacterium]|nr:ABC transporter ATP-binding protein [Gammaproteobacteria bacterium]